MTGSSTLSTGADIRLLRPFPRSGDVARTSGGTGSCADGQRWRIRRLRPDDGSRLASCFARLSPEARQARFFGAKARLGDAEIRHLCRPDGWDHLALGAFARTPAGADAELLGAVRCLRLPAQRNAAELAITVADDARGRGLGRVLLAALLRQARARGIRELHCEVLAVNRPMRALAVAFGAVVKGGEEGTILYRLPLSPTPGGFHVPASDGWLLPLMDPVAAHHACCTLFDQATAHGVAVLDGLGAYCLPGALLAQAGEPRPAPAEAA